MQKLSKTEKTLGTYLENVFAWRGGNCDRGKAWGG